MKAVQDYCQYTDVFYGNGAVDHFASEGLASKWFYIKALCGNTVPHAMLPFGRMSVGAYSGGYPTGYGCHYPNSCGGIRRLYEEMQIRGFSHLHQSGTGAIEYYYNYAIVTPFYGSVEEALEYHPVSEETASPGYYRVKLQDIDCELTTTQTTALHRYRFGKEGGRIAVDFSNDGLARTFGERYFSYVKDGEITHVSPSEVRFTGTLSGIRLSFAVTVEAEGVENRLFAGNEEQKLIETDAQRLQAEDSAQAFGAVFDFEGKEALVKLAFSTLSEEKAAQQVMEVTEDFDAIRAKAEELWNQALGVVDITTEDEELRGKFYSNLYHSLVKPCDMTGEEILGVKGDVVTDIATFWDQYKTVYPLIYLLYPQMGEKLVKAVANISRSRGRINCNFGLSERFPCEMQAKMLGILTLCDAYYCGISAAEPGLITECTKRELEREDFESFLTEGVFERYTHIIDTTDACLAVAEITEDEAFRRRLLELAANWVKAFDEDGLMSVKSRYYEGDRYTYSFRLQKNMEERIQLAGGKERFTALLDSFFGFVGEGLVQIRDGEPDVWTRLCAVQAQYHRFEGFNNECDMETPYAYVYAGHHEKTCEIIKEAVEKSFTTGKGALPGNNDSGGLSSCFVWNVLGIFPASGTGEFLLGCPQIKGAVLSLGEDKNLKIVTEGKVKEAEKLQVFFNGKEVASYRIPMAELIKGGELLWRPAC